MRRIASTAITLIEALLVVVLFAVIAGLAYQNSWTTMEKARIKAAWSILRLIDVAARSYNRDTGAWPTLTNLVNDGYINDPNQDQTEWQYLTFGGASPNRARAVRQGGRCNNKTLDRCFRGVGGICVDGLETESMPTCP